MQSYNFESEIDELKEKLKGTNDENTKLREKLIAFKKENELLNEKIGALDSNHKNQKQTILMLVATQEKLQKDLEAVKKTKDELRVLVKEKISIFSKENEIFTRELKVLTKELEAVENSNKELKRDLKDLTSGNTFLREKVVWILEENAKLKHDMGELRRQHDEVQEKLDSKETRLALGQVAWLLEAEIWKNVLPGQKMGKIRILNSMERWLKRNSGSDEGKDAQKRWDILKSKLNWNEEDHKLALKMLKDLRVDDAHPKDVNIGEAKKQLNEGDYIAESDKKICQEIIDMIAKARSLNRINSEKNEK